MLRNALYATIASLVIAIPLTAVWGQSGRQKQAPTLGERLGNLGRELFGPIEDGSFDADPFAPPSNERRMPTPARRAPERVASNAERMAPSTPKGQLVPRQPQPAASRSLPTAKTPATFDTAGSSRRRPGNEPTLASEPPSTASIPRRDSRSNFAAAEEQQPHETSPSQVTTRRRTYESPSPSRYVDEQQPQPGYAQAPARPEPMASSSPKVTQKRAYQGRGYAPHLARGQAPSRSPMMDHEEPRAVHEPTPARVTGEPTLAQESIAGRAQFGSEEGSGPKIVRNRHVEQPRAGSVAASRPAMEEPRTPRLARSQAPAEMPTEANEDAHVAARRASPVATPPQFDLTVEIETTADTNDLAAIPAEAPTIDEPQEEMVPDAVATDLGAEGRTLAERLAAARSFSAPKHPLRDPSTKMSARASNPAAPMAPTPEAQEIAAEVVTSPAMPAAATSNMLNEALPADEASQPLVGIPRKVTQPPSAAPPVQEPTPALPEETEFEAAETDFAAIESMREPTPAVAIEAANAAPVRNEPTPARPNVPQVAKAESPLLEPTPARQTKEPAAPSEQASTGDSVLLTKQSPVLAVETIGPRNIKVGIPARYRVVVENAGKVAAEGVSVHVLLPEWADVVGANASTGTARAAQDATRGVEWRVGRVESAGRQQLTLEITARRSEPLELDVRWSLAPVKSQTRVVVQEPKLEMRLDGPDEVNYGELERFTLQVGNPGNGDAEQVVVRLLPANADEEATEQMIGTVAAGETKTIDLELSALRSGTFWIKAEADGQGGLHTSVAAEVLVRRAALEVAMEGPAFQYAGTEGTYRVRLTNTGNAPARNVEVRTLLPAGAQHVESTETSRVELASGRVVWGLASLAAGEEREFELTCKLMEPGSLRPQVVCTAADDLTASHGVETKVEALADLSLEIRDPRGPVPVGSEARYEVRIKNRGTSAAHDIDVAAFFASGVEPVKATGAEHRLAEGQVLFDKIAKLDAGQELVLTIFAAASVSGNRGFRVELHCPELETNLAAEESTHFYDRRHGQAAAVTPADESAAVEQAAESSGEATMSESVSASEPTTADEQQHASSDEPTPAAPLATEVPSQP
ncbi:MAG: DUF11 domain-containing protein [Pirellulales bacterium]|nr:DUF11 domain-containing protein [Pirellulales bacterium]